MSDTTLTLRILTPLGVVFEGSVDQVTASTTSGEITILKDHVPMVSTLSTGHIMIRNDGEPSYFSVAGGVLEKRTDNTVVVLSSRSESALDIDVKRAQEAYEEAQKLMIEAQNNPELMNSNNLQKVLARELNRVRIGQKGGRK